MDINYKSIVKKICWDCEHWYREYGEGYGYCWSEEAHRNTQIQGGFKTLSKFGCIYWEGRGE